MIPKPKIIILCGLPGSGKTTYSNKFRDLSYVILSSDAIRKELYGDESIQKNPSEVFQLMQQRAVRALKNGISVVYDATNMTRKDRAGIINICPKFVRIECHVVWAPLSTCIMRDSERKRTVGRDVIMRMVKKFQMPYFDEGIDEVKIIRPDYFEVNEYEKVIMQAMDIPHDNPHHSANIDQHCALACEKAQECQYDWTVWMAAYYHDCGKPYVKSFYNNNGEVTKEAHYYDHQCVSAWVACGLVATIDIIWLISTHMEPFFNSKYYQNLPPYLKERIDELHLCDLAAH